MRKNMTPSWNICALSATLYIKPSSYLERVWHFQIPILCDPNSLQEDIRCSPDLEPLIRADTCRQLLMHCEKATLLQLLFQCLSDHTHNLLENACMYVNTGMFEHLTCISKPVLHSAIDTYIHSSLTLIYYFRAFKDKLICPFFRMK